MAAPTMSAEGLQWPPVNGSCAPYDNAPTAPIRFGEFAPGPAPVADRPVEGLGLGALLAAEIRATGGAASDQDDGVSMTWGVLRGLHGESDELATRARRPSAIVVNPGEAYRRQAGLSLSDAAPAEAASRTPLADRLASASRLSGAVAAERTVEMPRVTTPVPTEATSAAPRRSGSTLAASFAHRAPVTEPVATGFAADRADILDSDFARRFMATGQVGEQPVRAAVRTQTAVVHSHRMRSESRFMKLIHALPIPSWGRGRHVR